MESFAWCVRCHGRNPSVSLRLPAPLKGSLNAKSLPFRGDSPRGGEMPAGQRGPLSTRGTSEVGGGVLCKIFCLMCEVSRKNPSVTCGASSPFRGAYIPKGEPECKKPPLKGEGDRRRRWRGSVWNLLLGVKGLRDNPSVKPAACQLPFQGSLYTKREPRYKKASPLGEGDRRRRWRGSRGIFLCNMQG